jgi:hypothetical protein
MIRLRCIQTVVVVVAALSIFGCKSKQEAPGANGATPQQAPGAIKSISGQTAAGVVPTAPKDKTDAEAAAIRTLDQMEAGQFSAMYKDASVGFKQIGSEAAFVAKFEQTRQKIGPLKGARQASFITLPDQTHVLVYHLENDRFRSERRLTYARSKEGKMELFGLNQHDELKHKAAK